MLVVKMFAFAVLALLPSRSLGQDHASMDVSPMMFEPAYGAEPQMAHRSLYGWSFTNLLFHLGVCSASNCHQGHGPCGCPDCSKSHPVGWQKGYCNSYDGSVSSDGSYSDDGSSGASFYTDSDGNNKYYDDGSTNGIAQGSRRSWLPFLAVAMIGSAALAGLAFAMRKRTLAAAKSKGSSDSTVSSATNYNMMGAAGVGAAITGVMSKLGINKGAGDGASVTSGSSGIVSRRMALLESDGPPARIDEPSVAPSFIDIQSDTSSHWDEATVEAEEGIEVEGPFRPSSQYGV